MFDLPGLDQVWNPRLAGNPMNWAIVFVAASFWLLGFHVLMTGFGAMKSTGPAAIGANPGQVAAPTVNAPGAFAVQGALATGAAQVPGLFAGGGPQIWTDDSEAKYAEDGWYSA